jgi:hypothetical protein
VSPRLSPPLGSALLLVVGALSCGRSGTAVVTPTPAAVPGTDPCALVAAPGPEPDTLSVALTGDVDPRNAPSARTPAERFVFRQLYESLIRVDCTEKPEPGLASSWRAGESGRVWVFTIRAGATFWDGSAVTAADVVRAWNSRPEGMVGGVTAQAEGAQQVAVHLVRATSEVPLALADPRWAVTKPGADDGWPLGTGPYRVDTAGGRLELLPVEGRGPVVEVRSRRSVDMRDQLDAGVDVLVTAEPATLSYAADRPDLTTIPLPWDSTYVLLGQGRIVLPDTMRMGLARDAVRVDARPAAGPFWWMDESACDIASLAAGTGPFQPSQPMWVTVRGDTPARDLAERLVALGRTGVGPDAVIRAVSLDTGTFATSLGAGRAAGFILAVPRQPPDRCAALRDLLDRATWASNALIVPLIDTRRHVVVRRGAQAFDVDWDGTLRLR